MVDEAVVQRLVDEADLRKLILEMPRRLDERDWKGYGDLFTEDAVLTIAGMSRNGRKAIADGPSGDLEVLYEATYHFMGNIYLDINGDEARIVAYNMAIHIPSKDDPATHADAGGRYEAVARRTADGWLLSECHVVTFWLGGIPLAFWPADEIGS